MIARLLAGSVGAFLAVAGARKFVSRDQWKTAAAAQGLPASIVTVIPAVELLLGGWLVAFEPSPVPLGLATLLLLVFTVYLSARVLSGSAVPCACFGAASSAPPTWADVVRNLSLIAALFVAASIS